MQSFWRKLTLGLFMASAIALLTGCATDDSDGNLSPLPGNRPQPWEGPMPSTMNQGR